MLGVAITFELVALAAIFGVGGRTLGLSVLALVTILLGISVLFDRRDTTRPASAVHRIWTYFAVNERLSERAHARQRVAPIIWKPAADRTGFVSLKGLNNPRWRR